jgi:excisionase family DNA binding protein
VTDRPSRPDAYLRGDSVLVPARVADWLVRKVGLAQVRRDIRGIDPELDAVLCAMEIGARDWWLGRNSGSDHGTEQRKRRSEPEELPLTTADAATFLAMSERGVRKAIQDGRLPAQRHGDVWLINHPDAQAFRVKRENGDE